MGSSLSTGAALRPLLNAGVVDSFHYVHAHPLHRALLRALTSGMWMMAPAHIHVSEQVQRKLKRASRRSARSPVEWLARERLA
jgi:hypothetical protein